MLILQVNMRTIGRIFCKQCNVCFETEEELDTHVSQIHQFKKVKYVFVAVFMGGLGCVLGGILEGILGSILGGILGGALGGIFGAYFFAREEDLNKHQRMSQWHKSPHKSTGSEWILKKTKKERKMQNKKRRK